MQTEIFNTIPLIQPLSYHDEFIFQQEKEKLFKYEWNFAGFSDDLANPNDFITLDVGDSPVVIQNFNGNIKAFLNVCSHRFAQIQSGKKGNRAFFCPYHGWAYNDKGVPVGIPKKPKFGAIDAETMEELCLEEFRVETCGKLVFVKKKSDNSTSLEAFLGEEVFNIMQEMSNAFGKLIDVNELIIDANWKILVENTLEAYHISAVHPTTFLPVFGNQTFHKHSEVHTSISAELKIEIEKIEHMYRSRPVKIPGYFHQLIFPNLTLATSYGNSFSVQLIEPISPTKTRFVSYVFQTTLDEASLINREKVMLNAMNQSIIEFNRQVFSEDKDVCEKVQAGIKAARNRGLLSTEEQRVLQFHIAYNNYMNK